MRKFKAVFTLVRLPNLVFILLTQWLAHYFIVAPALLRQLGSPVLDSMLLSLLCLSTVLIAAAGYMINDYFDIGIDAINKPHKVTIEKFFKRRTVIIWHITLNLFALLMAGYIAYYYVQFRVIGIQLLCILLLLFYSTTFKRKLIIGNISIALLTSLTLLTVALYEPSFELSNTGFKHAKLLWMYVLFSFIITLIREIIKDIEDVKGDTAQHCETIPLVWGIDTAKTIVYCLFGLLLILLLITCIYFYRFNTGLVFYLAIAVFAPVGYIFFQTRKAITSVDFHRLSTYIKLVTLLGILSMTLISTH